MSWSPIVPACLRRSPHGRCSNSDSPMSPLFCSTSCHARKSRAASISSSSRLASAARNTSMFGCLRATFPQLRSASLANSIAAESWSPRLWSRSGWMRTRRASSSSGIRRGIGRARLTGGEVPEVRCGSGSQSLADLLPDPLRMADESVRDIPYRLGHRLRHVIPVAGALAVQVRGSLGKQVKGRLEVPCLSPGTAVPSQMRCLSIPLFGDLQRGGRTDEDRACQPLGHRPLPVERT